jgi:hypothetical protein
MVQSLTFTEIEDQLEIEVDQCLQSSITMAWCSFIGTIVIPN